jgi:hypothetical protein
MTARLPSRLLKVPVLAVGLLATACAEPPATALQHLLEARKTADGLLLEVTKSADASNRAVLAGTDESATAFGQEARASLNTVSTDVTRLRDLLQRLQYGTEQQILTEFDTAFKRYSELDQQLLDLAVQNTNLKAQRLSFGSAAQAADEFALRLKAVLPAAGSDGWKLRAATADAVAALREIQVLEAPHIAESDDGTMTELEKRMADREKSVRAALGTTASLAAPSSRSNVAAATAALDRFAGVHSELITLSRTNSNVRSLALVFGQLRNLRAACEGHLQALREALNQKTLGATR